MRLPLALATAVVGCAPALKEPSPALSSAGSGSMLEIMPVSEVDWQPLNPARGDASPRAGTLWGDRGGSGPTGFLARFVDGFSSPPHAHNVSYRAVVISGLVHNDDPGAAEMWMPAGSFWTQPKGEVHITSAKGADNVALVEIDEGPYLVIPPEESFGVEERPVNVHARNVVWVDDLRPGFSSPDGPRRAYLWGEPRAGIAHGTFIRLPAGFEGGLRALGSTFRAVVIEGRLHHGAASEQPLEPGSTFSSAGDVRHTLSALVQTLLYVHTNGPVLL